MTKHKCPYAYPARSRADMMAYIFKGRHAYSDHGSYLFNWNVKAHHVEWDFPKGDHELDPKMNPAWRDHLETKAGQQDEAWAFERAQYAYDHDEYATWPGDDQGDWKFGFFGRQGGHLCLMSWRGFSFRNLDEFDVREWLDGCEFKTVRDIYRALVCMDSDFTPQNASTNVEFYINDTRGQWEEERKETQRRKDNAVAQAIVDSRPDMAPDGLTQYGESAYDH